MDEDEVCIIIATMIQTEIESIKFTCSMYSRAIRFGYIFGSEGEPNCRLKVYAYPSTRYSMVLRATCYVLCIQTLCPMHVYDIRRHSVGIQINKV